ncbi:ribonuclease M5 [Anaerovorax odorimutans]|uniref:Ribonuclease M5 n=1 Tax=Anaerovorax odorimutans TaxID=109327 RepID=A0ABT1RQP9_9FIRM|nr:ribonuclease M5 [Anaerovorax odorimutans]MCQ4637519.1 ribonuclease M5 [Anaerovorax odorimutans]
MKIKETIVVEGRDDTAAIKQAVDAHTIETHGYGIKKDTWQLLEKAYNEKGIIIFTDPDYAGTEIRKRLTEKFPKAGQAYLSRKDAEKAGDIGIENASPRSIRQALENAHYTLEEARDEFTMEDLREYGLTAHPQAADRRDRLGRVLGIGYGNSKCFLNRLNQYGITRDQFLKKLEEI